VIAVGLLVLAVWGLIVARRALRRFLGTGPKVVETGTPS
jgi:uncharacterized protein YneF (UPF0154 family)